MLQPLLPGGGADLVVRPRDSDEIAAAVAAAHRYRVPVTVRGRGTGNYGQGIPLHGGLIIDTTLAKHDLPRPQVAMLFLRYDGPDALYEQIALGRGQAVRRRPAHLGVAPRVAWTWSTKPPPALLRTACPTPEKLQAATAA